MYRHPHPNMAYNRPQLMPRMQQFQPNTPRGPRYGHSKFYGPPPPPLQRHNEEYWCETCDRSFRSRDTLDSHKLQHQKCNIDGCQFIAHPKVITNHIQMQHSTGLFNKIGNLSKPEDIEKWRAERKKKYPTKENVEKKAAELKEKIERGEKMGLKRDKKTNSETQKRKYSNSFDKNYNRKNKNAKVNNSFHSNNYQSKRRKEEILPPPVIVRTLKPFAGILNLTMEDDNEIQEDHHFNYSIEDDDDGLSEVKMEDTSQSGTPVCGALSILMSEYGSSDEEDDKTAQNIEGCSVKPKDNLNSNHKKQKSNTYDTTHQNTHNKTSDVNKKVAKMDKAEQNRDSDDNCPPEETKIEKQIVKQGDNENVNLKHEKSKKIENNPCKRPIKKPKTKVPSTLLQKLLHREIQMERNIVLQCIRHVVKNKFFCE